MRHQQIPFFRVQKIHLDYSRTHAFEHGLQNEGKLFLGDMLEKKIISEINSCFDLCFFYLVNEQ
jgi:hypothetical protein